MNSAIGAGVAETLDRDGAFSRLDDDQRAQLRKLGRLRTVEPGEVLFAAGDAGSDFFVIESGTVAVVQGLGQEDRVIAVHGRHRFLGELGLLTGQRLYCSGVVRDAGQVIQVPVERLREIVAEDKTLSDLILGAFIARRSILIDIGTGIKLIGSRFSPDSRRLREFLARNRMPHQWIDLEQDEEADALLSSLGIEPDQTPVVIASGGEILRNPSNVELGRAIGLGSSGSPPPLSDVVVVGAGPAGLAAALYAASEGLDVQGVEVAASGGQAGTSARIENYLGFPAGISGSELAQRAEVQAAKFGARLDVPAAAVGLRSTPGRHEIKLSNGDVATGRTVVIATGLSKGTLGLPEESEYDGRGLSHCASCDGPLYAGRPVVVAGTEGWAPHEAAELQVVAGDVTVIGKATTSLPDGVHHLDGRIVALEGSDGLQSVVVESGGTRKTIPASAVFVYVGQSPAAEFLAETLARDATGHIVVDEGGRTSAATAFAVGDVRAGARHYLADAIADGQRAGQAIVTALKKN